MKWNYSRGTGSARKFHLGSVIFVLIYFLVLVLVFQLFF